MTPRGGQLWAAAAGNDGNDDNIDACQLQSTSLHNIKTCQQENDVFS